MDPAVRTDLVEPRSGGGSDGGNGGTAAAPGAAAPSDEQIAAGADESATEHHGHGDDDANTSAEPSAPPAANRPKPAGTSEDLAETGASAGAAALAPGSAALFLSVRWRSAGGGHRR
ncbi:hypothetical protein [Streptomyces flaveolus]|uniref:hypothetical protein n=1 Tax=Streptomyces flaveolus TaxID=67297 RepID=UPI003F541083